MKIKKPELTGNMDYTLLFITSVLVIFGTIMVFSSSVIMAEARWKAPYLFVSKHAVWVIVGAAGMYLMTNFNYRKLAGLSRPLLAVAVVFLIAVVIVGPSRGGAKRWIVVGPINFQPSEFAKLAVIVALADYLDRKKSKLKNFGGLVPPLLIMGVVCGCIALEPDLGTPIIISLTSLSLIFISGASLRHIFLLISGFLVVVVEEIFRKPYRLHRVKDFIASWGDINSVSYQLNQSMLALGAGGFFGKGLAQSQMKLLYLPEPHTDFIFPIIGEELGYLGTISVIMLFLAFAWRGWRISRQSTDYFGSLLALGITLLVTFQAIMNMSVACGLVPTKGLPLPFISFGGTALVLNMMGVGILLNISKRQR
jgi:cell division protein FtsW